MKDIPAFPVEYFYDDQTGTEIPPSAGMTLRDYFAAQALPVVMPNNRCYPSEAARAAYEFANAMMKARDK